jgi:hypothetical protein
LIQPREAAATGLRAQLEESTGERTYGQAENIVRERQAVLDVAYQLHPERKSVICSSIKVTVTTPKIVG